MKTSYEQYAIMVDFMEKYGDLSKPGGGPRGRQYIQMKWAELTEKLNSDGSGDSRSEERWRKVWSDWKNNCKKKLAKINRAAGGTGGGPALPLFMTNMENRVINIIGVQAATGMAIAEAGFPRHPDDTPESVVERIDTCDYLSIPGTSSQPPPTPLSPPAPRPREDHVGSAPNEADPTGTAEHWAPPAKRNKKDIAQLFLECERSTREDARARDRVHAELERERIRQRDEELRLRQLELRERVRQRDVELQLQSQWLELLRESLRIIERHFARPERND